MKKACRRCGEENASLRPVAWGLRGEREAIDRKPRHKAGHAAENGVTVSPMLDLEV